MIKYGSLFSGIGGFDLGLDRAGLLCAWQVEKDKAAQSVLKKHWPNVPKYRDVQDVGKQNLESVNLVCGGFPCQDLSIAGRRAGLAGERSGLWFEFRRIVAEIKPEWVIIENVPGLLSSNGGRDMGAIIGGLAKLGYWWAYRVLDAQYWGVPQRRRRLFIVGSLRKGCPQEVLFERESSPWDTPPSREKGAGFASEITSSLRTGGKGGYPSARSGNDWIVAQPACFQQNTRDEVRLMNGDGQIGGALSAQPGMKQQNYIAATLNSGGNNGGFRTEPGEHLVFDNSPTRPTCGVRRLTPLEAERLQGFPDNWTAGQSDTQRYRQLGNAVAVPVAEWIGRRIMGLDGKFIE